MGKTGSTNGPNCDHSRLGYNVKEQRLHTRSNTRTDKVRSRLTPPEACLNVAFQLSPTTQRQGQWNAAIGTGRNQSSAARHL